MKKVISLLLAVLLLASLSATAFADGAAGPYDSMGQNANATITAKFVSRSDQEPTVYHVTLAWSQEGTLQYSSAFNTYSWNTDTLEYTKTPTAGQWEVSGAKLNVTLTNRSNAAVKLSAAEPVKAAGITALDGDWSAAAVDVATAAAGYEATGAETQGTLVYTINAVEGAITTDGAEIATVTVTISAA